MDEFTDIAIRSLRLTDFRNYESLELSDIGALTILIGPNAVGKTSIVEAIQLVTALKSFRTGKIDQTVRWGQPSAQVHGRFENGPRQLDLDLTITGARRRYELNGKCKKLVDLKAMLPAVSFSPDDLHLAKGGAAVRRAALDDLGAQVSKNCYLVQKDYQAILKTKNEALKDEMSKIFIDSIDDVLLRVAVQLLSHRLTLLEGLRPHFQRFYAEITGGTEHATIFYTPFWLKHEPVSAETYTFDRETATAAMSSYIASHRQAEREAKRTLVGPHIDGVTFLLAGKDATHFASQGQQRSLVLAYKLAELAFIQERLEKKPILLLDDVMSELDETRRTYFMEFITGDIQTIITTTNKSYFTPEILSQANLIELG